MKPNQNITLALITSSIIVLIMASGCGSFPISISFGYTPTLTSTLTPTNTTTPTVTLTLTIIPTNTPRPTNTPLPSPTLTATPVAGTFNNPLTIGDKITVRDVPEDLLLPGKTASKEEFTLLEVKTGNSANLQAKQTLNWLSYKAPIEGQEYLAIRGYIKILNYQDNNTVRTIYPYWSLTLRSEKDGSDIWSENFTAKFNEGYPPVEGSGWVFFLIRKGSTQYLYFQTSLIAGERMGVRTHGAYFTLNK